MTVAFTIRRPWPKLSHLPVATGVRWDFGRMKPSPGSPLDEESKRSGVNPFPWWRPSSWSPFCVLAGRSFWWPDLVTVWHVDPERFGDDDSCKIAHRVHRAIYQKRFEKEWEESEAWHLRYRVLHETPWRDRFFPWRMHFWHWKIQFQPVLSFKRWAFSRCSKCGGRFRYGESPVSGSWYGVGPRWFRSEENTWHMRCDDSAKTAPLSAT